MRSSRTPHSVSSISTKSYLSSRTRHRSSSSKNSDSSQKPSRKMKFIIAIGIALPIVAAIIGVVAWAVSADTAFRGPIVSSLRRSDIHMNNHEEDIFQTLENRHDVEFSRHFPLPNQNLEKHDLSRLDTDENHNQFDDNSNKDPLYIVHFVPSPKPKVESSSSDANLASTVSNEVLQKILSASKGTKPGTPQFVVFAPVPEDGVLKNEQEIGTLAIGAEGLNTKNEEVRTLRIGSQGLNLQNEEVGTLRIGSQGLNVLHNKQGTNAEIDYDYEEELRKYQELLNSSDQAPKLEASKVEQSQEQTQTESIKESANLTSQNVTSGSDYQSHQTQTPNSNINQMINNNQHQTLNQQQGLVPQINSQQNPQDYSQSLLQAIPQGYLPQNVQQSQSYDQQKYQQQYHPQESNRAVQVYPHSPQATDRSGHYEPPFGIKLNIGGGNGHYGSSYSPLGIISSILKPILPRAHANLNGKLMLGVMLENGVKLGDRGQHHYG